MSEAEKIQTEIQKVIGEDPTIHDANRVIVTVEKQSFWKGGREVVYLKGSVRSDDDKTKIGHLAHLHAAGRNVVDAITVLH